MSITAKMPQLREKIHQRGRNGSTELDVFEAAGYFSGTSGTSCTEQKKMMMSSSGRISLDINPTIRNSIQVPTDYSKAAKDDKKYKQPNSPGARLASFLNSLFNQSSKKKKSKTTSVQDVKDDQDHELGRRKRRSSIGHFPSVNTTLLSSDSKSSSYYSSSSSQLKTVPPPYTNTRTKNHFKDLDGHNSVRKPADVLVNDDVCVESVHDHEKNIDTEKYSWLNSEKFKFGTNFDKSSLENYHSFVNGDQIVNYSQDGADSDSSSDLFELQNYDLVSCYSSDLPVYQTTHINSIKRGAPIASGAI